ncbi:uncharacterized protein LOC113982292 isoform X3 [Pipra filicauda]|uniref:Uncharacterized protein LOC113982292 isoform X3 n=1 Tax=Pipra filicauda TaxID=649802 RepID=A0A7R5L8A4_9PASS|nr:uncharacterized protein LOC113982292 isoform X3 [Pipra filicauda]
MDWFHCNRCYRQEGTQFAVTSCGHILCQACGGTGPCPVCSSACRYLLLSHQMRPQDKLFFKSPASIALRHLSHISQPCPRSPGRCGGSRCPKCSCCWNLCGTRLAGRRRRWRRPKRSWRRGGGRWSLFAGRTRSCAELSRSAPLEPPQSRSTPLWQPQVGGAYRESGTPVVSSVAPSPVSAHGQGRRATPGPSLWVPWATPALSGAASPVPPVTGTSEGQGPPPWPARGRSRWDRDPLGIGPEPRR